jgi:hypothetical protein
MLQCASFLNLPELLQATGDHTFTALKEDSVIDTLLCVLQKEYGEHAQLVETAGIAYLYRNNHEVGAGELSRLPLEHILKVLCAHELWVRSEGDRVALVGASPVASPSYAAPPPNSRRRPLSAWSRAPPVPRYAPRE